MTRAMKGAWAVLGVLLAAAPLAAQSAETGSAGSGAVPDTGRASTEPVDSLHGPRGPAIVGQGPDTLNETPAARAMRQRWASPFAVEGSGEPAPREARAHVTWLPPERPRRDTASPTIPVPPRTPATQQTPASATRRPATPPAAPASPARPRSHTVASGETFLGIARKYGLTQDALRAANPGVAWERVRVGVVLRIPPAPARATTPARPGATPAAAATTTRRPQPVRRDTASAARKPSGDSADSTDSPTPRRTPRDSARAMRRDTASARSASTAKRDTTARIGRTPPTTRRDSTTRANRPTSRDSTAARANRPTPRDSTASRGNRTAPRDSTASQPNRPASRDTASTTRPTARRDTAQRRAPPSALRRHTVVAGESLFSIARKYGVAAQRLRDVNGLTDDRMRIGQVLVIPPQD